MSDPPRARCPSCGRAAVRQISGGAGLIFKGSGFYITDYGKDGKGPRQEKEADSKPDAAEAKPDAAAAKPDKADGESKSSKEAKPAKSEKKSTKKKASS